MKIYNKKSFISGITSFLLSLVLLLCCIFETFDIKSVLLMIALFLFGMNGIWRSTSYQMSKQDKVDDLDERNHLIRLKSKSNAFNVTQIVCFILIIAFMFLGTIAKEPFFTYAGVGLTFGFNISMIAEIISSIYYEKHT
ncbi:conserved membrane protein of unknown function [Ruminococcaceae bacterium BL-4]|nr:conserved membrane protein of unknown function [Ruminococcaceae bacterium BL-4]